MAYPRQTDWLASLPVKNILFATGFLILAIWMGSVFVGYISDKNIANKTVPGKGQQQVVEKPTTPTPNRPNDSATPLKEIKTLALTIKANENCWMRVIVDGKSQYQDILPAGQQKAFQAQEVIALKVGNAGGVALTINDNKLPPLGEGAAVVEKVFNRKDYMGE